MRVDGERPVKKWRRRLAKRTACPHHPRAVLALVAHRETETNRALAASLDGVVLAPARALALLRPGDTALARLDVRPGLDGIEPGLWALGELAARGVRVLNPPSAVLTAHDKLLTARVLARAGVPHPRTRLALAGDRVEVGGPVVVKPRFGSWGRDVVRCTDEAELDAALGALADRPWAAQGALVQDLVPPRGYDLRLVVAGDTVVGGIRRRAAPGEWRTNVSLGARRERVVPPPDACALALAAAQAADADLVGVDLLPAAGGWVVLELNAAVDFTRAYARARDVFAVAAAALEPPPLPAAIALA
jgi:RimK family alpha-L-glutamate ligase